MEWFDIESKHERSCKFPVHSIPNYEELLNNPQGQSATCDDYIGGIFNDGHWVWLTRQNAPTAKIDIYSLSTGQPIANYTFLRQQNHRKNDHGYLGSWGQRCSIRSVSEILTASQGENVLLAVYLETPTAQTFIALYTPNNSQLLRYIDIYMPGINSRTLTFVDASIVRKTVCQKYDGCLAFGNDEGSVLLMDLNVKQVLYTHSTNLMLPDYQVNHADLMCVQRKDVDNVEKLNDKLTHCRQLDKHLMLVVDLPIFARISITNILVIDIIRGIAAALKDGRIILYDLSRFEMIASLNLTPDEPTAVVQGLSYIKLPDDPKPCFFICATYKQEEALAFSLISVCYKRSAARMNELFHPSDFLSISSRLRNTLDPGNSQLINCSTVSTFPYSVIGWHSLEENTNKVVFLDIIQWYKDEVLYRLRPNQQLNYMWGYKLIGAHAGLSLRLDTKSIQHFKTQRCQDAHFYPSALSFDCSLMTTSGCRYYEQTGVQMNFLNTLYDNKASVFLNPQPFVEQIMHRHLTPQFWDNMQIDKLTLRQMYEVILSVALEHSQTGLLNCCIRYCLDGSFMCNKLSLATVTNWIVNRASQIKSRCSELCHGVFDCGGYPLDDCEMQEFNELKKQLCVLHTLQANILDVGSRHYAADTVEALRQTERTLLVLEEYHRLLYWLIKQRVLPAEGVENQLPLQRIHRQYTDRRIKLQPKGIKLYIDAQLRHNGFAAALQKHCQEDGLYPPKSMQAFMRLILLPDVQLTHKHQLVLYLLFDLNHLHSHPDGKLVNEFADNFSVCEPQLKSVRCFWNLDSGNVTNSINALYGGQFENNFADWQVQMLIEVLLAHGAHLEALRVVSDPPGRIKCKLKLHVMLLNNRVAEAFSYAHTSTDEDGRTLVEFFFRYCIEFGKFDVLAKLDLMEEEEDLIYRLLRQCKTPQTDGMHLYLLLRRDRYIEAVALMDEVAVERQSYNTPQGESLRMDMDNIMSAYRRTMTPVIRSISDKYYNIRDKLAGTRKTDEEPMPLSSQLAMQNVKGQLGDFFKNAILSAQWVNGNGSTDESRSLDGRNVPFLCNPLHPALEPRREMSVMHNSQLEQSRAGKRKRKDADMYDDPTELQDDNLVAALLQPPDYFKFGPSEPVENTSKEPRPLARGILKRRLSNLVTPLVQPETKQQEEEKEDEQQPEEQQVKPLDEQEDEDMDEIIVEIEQQPATPDPDTSADITLDYHSPLTSPMSLADATQQLSAQEPPAMAPPTGPTPRSSLLQASSGYGSFVTVQVGDTCSLQTNAFVPPVCSSKMYSSSQIKFSERTTICGEVDDPTVLVSHSTWSTRSIPPRAQPAVVAQMLDTTLGMSTYDITSLDPDANRVEQSPEEDQVMLMQFGEDQVVEESELELVSQEPESEFGEDQVIEESEMESELESLPASSGPNNQQIIDLTECSAEIYQAHTSSYFDEASNDCLIVTYNSKVPQDEELLDVELLETEDLEQLIEAGLEAELLDEKRLQEESRQEERLEGEELIEEQLEEEHIEIEQLQEEQLQEEWPEEVQLERDHKQEEVLEEEQLEEQLYEKQLEEEGVEEEQQEEEGVEEEQQQEEGVEEELQEMEGVVEEQQEVEGVEEQQEEGIEEEQQEEDDLDDPMQACREIRIFLPRRRSLTGLPPVPDGIARVLSLSNLDQRPNPPVSPMRLRLRSNSSQVSDESASRDTPTMAARRRLRSISQASDDSTTHDAVSTPGRDTTTMVTRRRLRSSSHASDESASQDTPTIAARRRLRSISQASDESNGRDTPTMAMVRRLRSSSHVSDGSPAPDTPISTMPRLRRNSSQTSGKTQATDSPISSRLRLRNRSSSQASAESDGRDIPAIAAGRRLRTSNKSLAEEVPPRTTRGRRVRSSSRASNETPAHDSPIATNMVRRKRPRRSLSLPPGETNAPAKVRKRALPSGLDIIQEDEEVSVPTTSHLEDENEDYEEEEKKSRRKARGVSEPAARRKRDNTTDS